MAGYQSLSKLILNQAINTTYFYNNVANKISLSFAAMSFMRKKWIQQTGTSFLLLLFVFIHAVKTFHTHDYSYVYSTNAVSKNATVVKTAFACAICDFQIAKDSDAESATLTISTPLHFITAYCSYTLLQLHQFSITIAARGPPGNLV